ncbi:MAG: colicin E3/pyocin S6 family cytotoxin [Actinomycetota bacterium]
MQSGARDYRAAIAARGTPPPRDLPAFPDAKRAKPKTQVQGGRGLRKLIGPPPPSA